jgi:hypothetical protein
MSHTVQIINRTRKTLGVLDTTLAPSIARTFDLFDIQQVKGYAAQLAAMAQRGEIDVVVNSTLSVAEIAALDSAISSALISQEGVLYVGKHGADTNDGRTVQGALLTFAQAVSLATSGEVIKCIDQGLYQESVDLPSGVNLWAPYCTIESPGGGGTGVGCIITNGGEVTIRAHKLTPGSGETGIVQKDYAGVLNIDCDFIDGRDNGSSDGLLNLSTTAGGVMMARVRSIWVPASGVGIGDLAVGVGHIHLDIGDIYLAGNSAIGIFLSTSSKLVGRVDHIVEAGGSFTSTKGIDISAGVASINVSDITADTVYDVQAGATLNMFVNSLTGAVGAGTGTKNVTTP